MNSLDESQKGKTWENPSDILYPRSFDTAIRSSFLDKYLEEIKMPLDKQSFETILLSRQLKTCDSVDSYITTPEHYAIFISKVLDHPRVFTGGHRVSRLTTRAFTLVKENLHLQYHFNLIGSYPDLRKRRTASFSDWEMQCTPTPLLINLCNLHAQLNKLNTISNQQFNPKFRAMTTEERLLVIEKLNIFSIPELQMTFRWTAKYLVITLQGKVYVQPRSVLLLYLSKVSDLISILVLCITGRTTHLPDTAYQETITLLREMCRLLIHYKNGAFVIFKVLESLVIGETLVDTEDWCNTEFIDTLTSDLRDELGYNYEGSRLQMIIRSADVPMRHELGCLSKILGHPLVDMEAGAKKLHSRTTQPTLVDVTAINRCICHFKKSFIQKYLLKHHKWPPVILTSDICGIALTRACMENKDPDSHYIKSRFGEIDIDAYNFVELGKIMEFQNFENLIPELKDRAISLFRSPVMRKYIDNIKTRENYDQTKLLLNYILNLDKEREIKEYMRKYINVNPGAFDLLMEYLTIRIVPKEKELKSVFRGFGCKTMEERHRGIVQEKNVSYFLERYSDEQTMTISELSLLRKLDAFRRMKQAYRGHIPLYIVVDSSAWNNKFSHATVDLVMQETLDKLFGNQIFSRTHLAFENTLFYIPDETKIFWWEGQRGGIEGLNQYTWVAVYLAQLHTALEDFPYKTHILCKGDDIRIAVMIPETSITDDSVGNIKKAIVDRIAVTLEKFGHTINRTESYGSSKYMAFSKVASLEMTELPQTFRKIMKTHGSNNAFLYTLDEYIGATYSNAHSACKVCPNTVPQYAVALFWAYWYLLCDHRYGSCSNDQLIALLLVPSLTGGFPMIYLHNFHVRAESDLLSPFIALYNYVITANPSVASYMQHFMTTTLDPPASYIGLYKDAYSLPSTRPALPASLLRQQMSSMLMKYAKNQTIRQICKAAVSPDNDKLMEVLDSCNVLRAKALSALYSTTPKALLEELVRKFESATSIYQCLLLKFNRRKVTTILRKLKAADDALHKWRVNILQGKQRERVRTYDHLIVECPTRSADQIREYCWGKRVEDVTMPPLQHLLYYKNPYVQSTSDWESQNHFTYVVSDPRPFWTLDGREHYHTGEYTPFIGFTTRTGLLDPQVRFVEKDPSLSKVRLLLDLANWFHTSAVVDDGSLLISNTRVLCTKLLQSYTSTTLQELAPFSAARRSGTAQHHLRAGGFKESIVPNVLLNSYSRVRGETNSHNLLRTSEYHYRINFLHCYTHSVWNIFFDLETSKQALPYKISWGVTRPCQHCLAPIEETPLVFSSPLLQDLELPMLQGLRISSISERVLMESLEVYQENVLYENIGDEGLGYQTAVRAIVNEIILSSYMMKKRLQDRFADAHLNAQGMTILGIISGNADINRISLTEVKRLPAHLIAGHLLQHIVTILIYDYNCHTQDHVAKWVNITPLEHIPWSDMLHWLHQAGVMEKVLHCVEICSGVRCAGAYHNYLAAARFCAIAAYGSMEKYQARDLDQTFQFFSHYQTPQLEFFIRNKIRVLGAYMVTVICAPDEIRAIRFDGPILDQVVKTCKERIIPCLILVYGLFYNEDLGEHLVHHLQVNPEGTLIIDYEEVIGEATIDLLTSLYDTYLESPLSVNHTIRSIFKLLKYVTKSLTLDEFVDILVQEFDKAHQYLLEDQITLLKPYFAISITRLTLSDCICRLRQGPMGETTDFQDSETVSAEEVDAQLRSGYYDNMLSRVDFIPSPNVYMQAFLFCMTIRPWNYIAPVVDPKVTIDTLLSLIDHYPRIDEAYKARILGGGNASSQILYDILEGTHLLRFLSTPMKVACLYDGQGGFTSIFNHFLTSSHIIFHTLPLDDFVEVHPSSILDRSHKNLIDATLANSGHYDFEHLAVRTKFIQYAPACSFVTSDMEHPDPFSAEYVSLTISLVIFFLTVRTANGCLIMRLDLRAWTLLARILDVLSEHCAYIYLIYPKCELFPSCIYLVAFGHRGRPLDLETVERNLQCRVPSQKACLDLERLTRHLVNCIQAKRDQYETSLIHISQQDVRIHRLPLTEIGLYSFAQVSYHTGKGLTVEILEQSLSELLKASNRSDLHHAFDLANLNPDATIKDLERELQKPLQRVSRSQTWDQNTRAARLSILSKLFYLYGLSECLGRVVPRTLEMTLQVYDLLASFLSRYITLDTRDQIQKLPHPIRGSDIALLVQDDSSHDKHFRTLFSKYIQGCNHSLSLLVTLLTIVAIARDNISEEALQE